MSKLKQYLETLLQYLKLILTIYIIVNRITDKINQFSLKLTKISYFISVNRVKSQLDSYLKAFFMFVKQTKKVVM